MAAPLVPLQPLQRLVPPRVVASLGGVDDRPDPPRLASVDGAEQRVDGIVSVLVDERLGDTEGGAGHRGVDTLGGGTERHVRAALDQA